ncbi:hypothetical protein RZS08_12885, partial [Arthrospira platensis SPKY1]|nr:hypothetical protein [Arthrospira platensis SPKY1]
MVGHRQRLSQAHAAAAVVRQHIRVRLVDQEGVRAGGAGRPQQGQVALHRASTVTHRRIVLHLAGHQHHAPSAAGPGRWPVALQVVFAQAVRHDEVAHRPGAGQLFFRKLGVRQQVFQVG